MHTIIRSGTVRMVIGTKLYTGVRMNSPIARTESVEY